MDPVNLFDGLFDDEDRWLLDAFGDELNRAMFAYVISNDGRTHIDDLYDTLSESKEVEKRYDDFQKSDLLDRGEKMNHYLKQVSENGSFNPDDFYFEVTAKGEAVAEAFDLRGAY